MKVTKLLATLSAIAAALAADGGSFNVLTFNIAGLPKWINKNGIPGGKHNAAKAIGREFAAGKYDIIHVQEDFAYHRALYRNDNHKYRTSHSGNVPFGNGLSTLSNFRWSGYMQLPWRTCAFNEGDCWTQKGFTYMRVWLDEYASVDMYNLHADAGDGKWDFDARKRNMELLSGAIKKLSDGHAVIVMGDTNCRYTEPRDSLGVIMKDHGLLDPWMLLVQNGTLPFTAPECSDPTTSQTCETIDKVLYRSDGVVSLVPTSHQYVTDRFKDANGGRLSDHNAVLVNFNWTRRM